MLKLLGLKTNKEAETDTEAKIKLVAQNYAEVLERMKNDYDKSLKRITDEYNEKLEVREEALEALQKENDDLLEDLALSFQGYQIPNRTPVTLVMGTPERIKGATVENKSTTATLSEAAKLKEDKVRKTTLSMIPKVEKRIKSASQAQLNRGGGITILKDGQETIKNFYSEKELRNILADAKAGKLDIPEQKGL